MHNTNLVRRIFMAVLATVGFGVAMTGMAQERGTAAEAQALVARVIAMYDANGQAAAFAAVDSGASELKNKDLYIFIYGPDRTIVAHGADTSLIGTVADTLFDVDGVPFGKNFMDDSTEAGSWMDYKWQDPITEAVQPKSSWIVKHKGYIFGAGIYLP